MRTIRTVITALSALIVLSPPAAAQISSKSLRIQGAGLKVITESVTTGIDMPTTVQTEFGGKQNDEAIAIEGVVAAGDLTGPGLTTPIQLTTAPGHKFQIPGLSLIGEYYLQNIRMMKGSEFLQYATPAVATIHVADLLQTKVTVRQLSPDELRARGITVDSHNFDVFEYTFTFIIDGKEVQIPFPVIIDPRTREARPAVPEQQFILPGPKLIEPPRWTPPTIIPMEFGEEGELPEPGKDPLPKEPAAGRPRIPAAIVIPNSLAVLHQFFAVGLMVTNGAPSGSTARLEDLNATIRIPTALRTARTTPAVAFGQPVPIVEPTTGVTFLIAQARGEAEWILEGLQAGTHRIDFELRATLRQPGQVDIPMRATPSTAIVIHDPRFNINFSHPDTVRKGLEYSTYAFITNMSPTDQTIVVNTEVQPCDVNPEGNACRLNGGQSDHLTIPSGEMRVVEYRLRAGVTGRVFATSGTLSNDANLSASVRLHMGVSESGIPLSPATLLMPYYAQFVEPDVVSANLQLLGLGYSLATAPLNAMTAKFPRVIKTDVFQRAVDVARAGQRIFITDSNPDARRDTYTHLALDLLGNGGHELREWDELRRKEKSGRSAGASVIRQLEAIGLTTGVTMAQFVDAFASATAHRPGYVAALAHGPATGTRPYAITLVGRATERRTDIPNEAGEGWVRSIPFSDISRFNGGGETGELALVGRWTEDLDVKVTPAADGAFSIELIYPHATDGRLLRAHFDITGRKNETITIPLARGATSMNALLPNGGVAAPGATRTIDPAALRILGARQDLHLDVEGHKVSLLYNRPVRFQDGVTPNTRYKGTIHFERDGVSYKDKPRPISSAVLQEDGRTVNLTFDHTLSVNAGYLIQSLALIDPTTSQEVSFPEKVASKIDNDLPAGIVYGKVVKGDNTPIVNADVSIRQYKPGISRDPSGFPQFDVSGADGSFLFEYVRRQTDAGWSGAYRLAAVTTEGKSTTLEGSVRLPGKVHFVSLQFLGRGAAEGYVRYNDGSVVSGANVVVGSTMFDQFRSAVSDVNGYYRVEDLPVGPLTFSATDKDGNVTFAASEIATPGQLVTQNLSIFRKPFPGTGRIYGVVTRSDTNQPVAGAHVGVYSQGYGLLDGHTDAEGRFDFPKVPSGFVTLLASEWSISRQAVALDFDLRADEVRQSNMILAVVPAEKRTSLSGEVWRQKPLQPGVYERVAGALVKISGYRIVTADSQGRFTYDDIPLSFSDKGITAYDPATQRVKETTVPTLSEAGPNNVSIFINAFDRGHGTIRVRVLNAAGSPVRGYRVIVPGFPPDVLPEVSAGVYEMKNVPTGAKYEIQAVPSGSRPASGADPRQYGDQYAHGETRVEFNGHIAALTLRLPGQGTVRVKVRSQIDLITPVTLSYAVWDEAEQGPYGLTLTQSTEKNGAADLAVFSNIPALSNYTVASAHPEYGYAATSSQLSYNGDFNDHTLQLNTLATVRGQVLSIDGLTPVAGATVTIFNGRSDPGPRITGPDGRFEFHNQPANVTVTVTAQVTQNNIFRTGISSARTPGNGGVVENMTVVLKKRGFVDGRVVYKDYKRFDANNPANNIPDNTPGDYSDNAPVPLAKFYLRELDFPHRNFGRSTEPLTADITGRFVLNHVFIGSLRATGWDSGNEELRGDWTGSISEEGAEAAPKAYIAVSGGSAGGGVGNARITVVDPNQSYAAVQNAEVSLYTGGGHAFDFGSTDATGSVELTELPAGSYHVSAYSKALGKTSRSEGINVVRDGIAAARLELEFSGKVDGTLTDPEANDRPVPGAHIRLTASNYASQASTDVNGFFLFNGVREGTFTLDVKDTESNRRDSETRALTVLDPHRTVKLELEPTESLFFEVYLPSDTGGNSGVLAPPVTVEVAQRCWWVHGSRHCDYVRELQGNPLRFDGALEKAGYGITLTEIGGLQRKVGLGGSFPLGTQSSPFRYVWPAYGDVNVTVTQGGAPASGAKVVISGPNKSVTVYTDGTGAVSGRGLGLGNIYVQATSIDGRFTGSASTVLQRQSVAATASIALGTYGGVTGLVFAEKGGISEGTRVIAHFSGNVAEIRTDGEGRYTILGIPAAGSGTRVDLTLIGPDDSTVGGYRSVTVVPGGGTVTVPPVRLDATPPRFESILPEDGSMNVSPDTSIVLSFTEALHPGTVNGGTFQLVDANGGAVGCSFDWIERSDGKFFVTMRPHKPATGFPLKSNTLYRVVVTNGVTDIPGHRLPATLGFTFTTSDYAEPRVQKVLPASPIPRAATFEFRFNEPIDPAPWQNNGQPGGNGVFRIYKIASPGGPGAAVISELGGRAFVDPATNMTLFIAPNGNSPIEPESFYRVTFNGVRDPQGNVLAEQTFHFFSFDETPPHVLFTAPPSADTLVSGAEYELRIELRNGSSTGSLATDVAKVEYFTISASGAETPFASPTRAPFFAKILGPEAPESGATLKVGAQAIDASGNRGPKTTAQWSVKPNAAPKNVSITTSPASAYPSNKVHAVVTFEDEGSFASVTTSFSAPLTDGTHSAPVSRTQSYSRLSNGNWPEVKFTFDLPLTAKPGMNATFTTTVADVRGLVSAPATGTVAIAADLIQPVIVSTRPAANTSYAKTATYVVEAVVRDDETAAQSVTFLVDGKPVAVASATTDAATRQQTFRSVTVTVPPVAEDKTIPIVITAKDYGNNTRSTTFDVVYKGVNDPDAPKVTWLCPVDGGAIPANRDIFALPLRIRVIDQDITSVTFTTNATPAPALSNVSFNAGANEYSATLTFAKTPAPGTLTVTAIVKDTIESHTIQLPISLDVIQADFVFTDPKAIIASEVATFQDKTIALIGGEAVLAPQVPLRLANLLVHNGARVETIPTTILKEYKIDLTVTGVTYVDCDSRIDVSERGYVGGWRVTSDGRNDDPRGRTVGNTSSGGADSGSQGSHAGFGGIAVASVTNASYGSITRPTDLGSGGGGSPSCCTHGASGGGAVALHGGIAETDASRIVLLGSLRADGGHGVSQWAGGAGGSIWLEANQVIFGSTTRVSANGGDDDGDNTGSWGGGGGRISISATTKLGPATAVIEARGGRNHNQEATTSGSGGGGTVLIRKPGQEHGDLTISAFDSRYPNTVQFARPTPLGRIGRGTSTAVAANALNDTSRTFDRWMIGEELIVAGVTTRSFTVTGISADSKTLQTDPADGSLLTVARTQTVAYEGLLVFDKVIAGRRALLVFDNHIESARVRNDRTAMTVEPAAVVVLRDDEPSITASTTPPAGGNVLAGGNFTFSFGAASAAGVWRVVIKWTPITTDRIEAFTTHPLATGPRSVTISTPDTATLGAAQVTATVIDRTGRTISAAPIMLQITQNQPPTVDSFMIEPVSLEVHAGKTVKATVTARDDLAVRKITLTGTLGSTPITPIVRQMNLAIATEAFDVAVPKETAGGTTLTLQASVEDLTTGHTPVGTAPRTITIQTDSGRPQVTITSPLSTSVYNEGTGSMIPVRVTATDAEVDVKQMTMQLNDSAPINMTRVDSEWRADVPVPSVQGSENVPMTIAVVATDYAGNSGNGSVTFQVKPNNDPNAPKVSWACSSPSAMYPPGHAARLRVYAVPGTTETSNGVSKVELFINRSTTPVTATPVSGLANYYEATYTIPQVADGTVIDVTAVATSVSNLATDSSTKITVVTTDIPVISANFIIDSLNAATFKDKTIIITGGVVTIDAPISPDRLLVLGGSIWQRANDPSTERRVEITATRGTYIACDAYISASGRGYQEAGRTWPNTATGGSAAAAGGSHGGNGGNWFDNIAASEYGSFMDPNTPGGAGGGSCCNAGGGIVRLKAKTITLDGGVYSNGNNDYAGGAGGSIRLDADVINGGGEVRAEGGISTVQDWTGHSTGWRYHGSGGGGRIALYFQNLGLTKTSITTASPGNTQATRGATGTVYLRKVNAAGAKISDELIFDQRGITNEYFTDVAYVSSGTVTAVSGNVVTLSKSVPRWIEGSWIEFIDANNALISAYEITARTDTTITVALPANQTAANAPVGSTYRQYWHIDTIIQRNSAQPSFGGIGGKDMTLTGTIHTPFIRAQNLSLIGSVIAHHNLWRLDVLVDNALIVDANSRFDVSGKGYPDNVGAVGRTYPNTFDNGSVGWSGGSHGGYGGAWFGDRVGHIYGSLYDPDTYGAAGGSRAGDCWGCNSGGGILRIKAKTITLNGKLLSNGNWSWTGGAGGSIRIDADTLQGGGEIRADGGQSTVQDWTGHGTGWRHHGSGGGGRIAIYYNTFGLDRSKISAGVQNPTYDTRGSAGTVYLKSSTQTYGELIVDTNGVSTPSYTTIPAISYGKITALSSTTSGGARDIVTDANAKLLAPDHFRGVRLFVNGNMNTSWPIKSNTATAMTLNVSASPFTGQVGDSYRGLYQFDTIKLRNARLISLDEIKSVVVPDTDGASSISTNAGPPIFDPAKLSSIVVENSAGGDFVTGPANTVSDPNTPIRMTATNARTSQTFGADASNGGFRIPVAGNIGDTFTLRATDSHPVSASSPTVLVNGAITEYNSVHSLSLQQTTVSGGADIVGAVRLAFAARSGGTLVTLSSSNPAVQVPTSIPVLAGTTSASITVKTSSVTSPVTATITATLGSSTATATLTLIAVTASLTQVTLTPNTVEGGTSINGSVVLGAPAPIGGALVSLSSSDTRFASVSDVVLVPEGATSAAFTVTTNRVAVQSNVTITGVYGAAQSATATLNACTSLTTLPRPAASALDTMWIEDAPPAGSTPPTGTAVFDSTQVASGSLALHFSGAADGVREFGVTTTTTMSVGPNDKLVAWALVNPCNPPKQIMFSWKGNNTSHRVTWGENRIDPVANPSITAGTLPRGGVWTRLEVAARSLGITATVPMNELKIQVVDGEAWIDAIGKTACVNTTAPKPEYGIGEQVWFDDEVPAGAVVLPAGGALSAWTWTTDQAASGTRSHVEPARAGYHEHGFHLATAPVPLTRSDVLFAYVYLDPCNPPRMVNLQWNDGTGPDGWAHRAYWGESLTPHGTEGTASRLRLGPLPEPGKWVRLEVPAVAVGLAGRAVSGMGFTLYDGQAWFDRAGKVARVNVAYGKPATQSTTHDGDPASRAVDGNVATGHGSMSVTTYQSQAWWEVDLGAVHPIDTIDIYGRTDCCTDQTASFYVLVSEQPFGDPANLDAAIALPGVRSYLVDEIVGTRYTVHVRHRGRYIRIQRFVNNHLSLPEVEVWTPVTPQRINLAGGTPRYTLSSYYRHHYARNAFNGDSDRSTDQDRGFYHSVTETEPFLEIDIGSIQPISSIDLASRIDGWGFQTHNLYALVSDVPLNRSLATNLGAAGVSVYYYRGTAEVTSTHSIVVNRAGRYVRLQKAGNDYFSIAEISVWAQQSTLKPLSTTKGPSPE